LQGQAGQDDFFRLFRDEEAGAWDEAVGVFKDGIVGGEDFLPAVGRAVVFLRDGGKGIAFLDDVKLGGLNGI
jgi:hypothetical protein